MLKRAEIKEVLVGRLQRGDDLLEVLTGLCKTLNLRLGKIQGIGAVERARLGFYDQGSKEYGYREFDLPMEILSLTGNISLLNGEPMLHAHITLGTEDGQAFGGHLAPGTRVFAFEYTIEVMEGAELHRCTDDPTGLLLWDRGCKS